MRYLVRQRGALVLGVELLLKSLWQHYSPTWKGKGDRTRLARGEPYRSPVASVAQRDDHLAEIIGRDGRPRGEGPMQSEHTRAEPDQHDRADRQPCENGNEGPHRCHLTPHAGGDGRRRRRLHGALVAVECR